MQARGSDHSLKVPAANQQHAPETRNHLRRPTSVSERKATYASPTRQPARPWHRPLSGRLERCHSGHLTLGCQATAPCQKWQPAPAHQDDRLRGSDGRCGTSAPRRHSFTPQRSGNRNRPRDISSTPSEGAAAGPPKQPRCRRDRFRREAAVSAAGSSQADAAAAETIWAVCQPLVAGVRRASARVPEHEAGAVASTLPRLLLLGESESSAALAGREMSRARQARRRPRRRRRRGAWVHANAQLRADQHLVRARIHRRRRR